MIVLPFFLLYKISGPIIGKSRAFSGSSQLLSLFPGLLGQLLRRGFYVMTLKTCSHKSIIDFGTFFPSPDVTIGKQVYIGADCIIAPCRIENDVIIGSGVHIVSKNTHFFDALDKPIRLQKGSWKPVNIGKDCWIGNKSIIMADVGNHCVIGAGSVVEKPVEDRSIAVGNPAKIIRKRK
jgi:acetyltransferase-like isoleucine patch superfamily enzyme